MAHIGSPHSVCPCGRCVFNGRGDVMGSVVKKRRKKIAKHKYKKLRKRMRHQRRKK
jgi:hypothetical protein